jgi:FlaA1/EpsC-like NDP-sugar epimerase
MLKRFIINNSERFLSRWVVLVFDLLLVLFAYQSSVLLRFNLEPASIPESLLLEKIPLILGVYVVAFLVAKPHVGVIRHTSFTDVYAIFRASFLGSGLLAVLSLVGSQSDAWQLYLALPNSIILIHFLLNLFLMISSRVLVKVMYRRFHSSNIRKRRVMIYGAGTSGIITKNTLQNDTSREFDIVGFIDDNPFKIGKTIEGIPVYSPKKALSPGFVEKHRLVQLVISIQSRLEKDKKASIVERALQLNLHVKIVPPVGEWIHGELSTKQIKNVKIEDLLERDPIKLDSFNVKRELKDQVVLISGAAGSIGSEIARQCLAYAPRKVILLDQAESALYDVDYELKTQYKRSYARTECIIGNVCDSHRLNALFERFRPDVVFHAAAYKHVPLMEGNPYEAVGVNVLGTKNMADMAVEYGVSKFVMVSTDKAVNPSNVMGASKRTAELYTQSLGQVEDCPTQFITTRFGNVLGSNGSVIPLFRKQINTGGPITITHRDITRYFMTIPEACNLVLEAGAMGKGGEIFVFNMGKSVKIIDLAKKMIKLSGLELGKDIEIEEVGLRPGEKLYEELLATSENTTQTHHPKIMVAKTMRSSYAELTVQLQQLKEARQMSDPCHLVRCLKEIVPEYLSSNSDFSALDTEKQASNG